MEHDRKLRAQMFAGICSQAELQREILTLLREKSGIYDSWLSEKLAKNSAVPKEVC